MSEVDVKGPGPRSVRGLLAGAPGRIRTCDTRFRRAVLYPLSYEGIRAACVGPVVRGTTGVRVPDRGRRVGRSGPGVGAATGTRRGAGSRGRRSCRGRGQSRVTRMR